MEPRDTKIIIVTGLSGSGKTTALKVLEDIDYYCIDNLPPVLFPKFIELCSGFTWEEINRIALGMDVREGEFLKEYPQILYQLRTEGYEPEIVFLDSSDEVLIRRYSETRRTHPLSREGSIQDGIRREREALAELKRIAKLVIDTSEYTVHELRHKILQAFRAPSAKSRLTINIVSFGFRFGVPSDADLVMDVRFLPNPYFVQDLRPLSGADKKVADFVLQWEESQVFVKKFEELLGFLIPLYEKEGKSYLTIAVGCTGGRHRSVAMVDLIKDFFDPNVYALHVRHRDVDKH